MQPITNKCCDINKIINEFHNQLRGYLIKNVHNVELADDISQEVLFKLISAYNQNVKIHNIKAWLFEIARHTVADYYRNLHKDVKAEVYNLFENSFVSMDDSGFSPTHYIIPMIKLLPEKYSVPLYMSDIDNLPQNSVAEKLGLSLSATKMRIQRARKMLYNLFVECCEIEYTKGGAFSHCNIKENCTQLFKADK